MSLKFINKITYLSNVACHDEELYRAENAHLQPRCDWQSIEKLSYIEGCFTLTNSLYIF